MTAQQILSVLQQYRESDAMTLEQKNKINQLAIDTQVCSLSVPEELDCIFCYFSTLFTLHYVLPVLTGRKFQISLMVELLCGKILCNVATHKQCAMAKELGQLSIKIIEQLQF